MFSASSSSLKVPWYQFESFCQASCSGTTKSAKEGWLIKRGNKRKNWKRRFFVLNANILFYCEEARNPNTALGLIFLERCNFKKVTSEEIESANTEHRIELFEGQDHVFSIKTVDGRTYYLSATSAEECQGWLKALTRSRMKSVFKRAISAENATRKLQADNDRLKQTLTDLQKKNDSLQKQLESQVVLHKQELSNVEREFFMKQHSLQHASNFDERLTALLNENTRLLQMQTEQIAKNQHTIESLTVCSNQGNKTLNHIAHALNGVQRHLGVNVAIDSSCESSVPLLHESKLLDSSTLKSQLHISQTTQNGSFSEALISPDEKSKHGESFTSDGHVEIVNKCSKESTHTGCEHSHALQVQLPVTDSNYASLATNTKKLPLESMSQQLSSFMLSDNISQNVTGSEARLMPPLPPTPKSKNTKTFCINNSTKSATFWVGTWNLGAVDPLASVLDPADKAHAVRKFVPLGYDVYVLGVQEGINDGVFDAVATRLAGHGLKRVVLRSSRGNIVDRVKGRGDGALLTTKVFLCQHLIFFSATQCLPFRSKHLSHVFPLHILFLFAFLQFTAIACFAKRSLLDSDSICVVEAASVAETVGSKGAVAFVMLCYGATLCFVNCHLAAFKPAYRVKQYRRLERELGTLLGLSGMNTQFSNDTVLSDNRKASANRKANAADSSIDDDFGLGIVGLFHQVLCAFCS